MGLFGRKDAGGTGNSLDDATLQAVAARSDLKQPRHWIHYVYCDDETGARTIAHAASQNGWTLQRVEKAATGAGWVVIAEQSEIVLTPAVIRSAREFFERLAGMVQGGDYDGWEASV